MPSIIATPFPARGQVLVEVDFSDIPAATHVCVEAVTGDARRPLHAYASYNTSGCIALSCGQAILWDTEISCDAATAYCATAMDVTGTVMVTTAPPLVADTWTRVTAADWGTADSGQTWAETGGAPADYSSTGTRGQMALTSTNVDRVASIAMTTPNALAQVTNYPAVVAATQPFEAQVWLRGDAAAQNGYRARIRYLTTGSVDFFIDEVTAGVGVPLATAAAAMTYTAATAVTVQLRTWGTQLAAKIWDATTPEPAAFTVTATDTGFMGSGTVNLLGRRDTGNTNGTINMQWDNLTVTDVCAEPVPIEECTAEVTIACDGCFRLGDPVRPCNDVRICLCEDGVECGGDGGIYLAGMSPDTYPDNSGSLLPVNAVHPVHISRNRRSASGNFTIVPTSFAARDALLALLAPGSVLLWRGPGEYGTGDRYLAIADVPVAPQLADLRIQDRVVQLPFVVETAPVGPSLGVCSARIADLCEVYATWDEMAAAGVTYADLLRGDAGGVPSGLATWDTIDAEYASWNALQAGETDWADVLDGD